MSAGYWDRTYQIGGNLLPAYNPLKEKLATAPNANGRGGITGLMVPGDKAKLNKLLYGPNGEILLDGTGAGGVGRYTRLTGPQEDVHLRSGDAAGSYTFLEATDNIHMSSNLIWNGTAWVRRDDTQKGAAAIVSGPSRSMLFYSVPAAAGPIASFNARAEWRQDPATASTTHESNTGSLIFSANQAFHIASNLTLDASGAAWNLQDTGRPGYVIVFGASNTYGIYVATAGANPRPLTNTVSNDIFNYASAFVPPRAIIVRTTAQAIAHATTTAIAFDGAYHNQAGGSNTAAMWSAGNPGRIFANFPGIYLVTGTLAFAPSLTGWIRQAQLVANSGFSFGISNATPLGGGNAAQLGVAGLVGLAAGGYVELWAYHDNGAALNTIAGYPQLSAMWLGPN